MRPLSACRPGYWNVTWIALPTRASLSVFGIKQNHALIVSAVHPDGSAVVILSDGRKIAIDKNTAEGIGLVPPYSI